MKTLHFFIIAVALTLTSCAGVKNVPFSANQFQVSPKTGYVQNADSTLRFTFCSNVIEQEIILIDSETATTKYKNLNKYLGNICSQLKVDCDSILFYSPSKGAMLVEISEPITWKPRSITSNMAQNNQTTIWVRDDDNENWQRSPSELYSNIILNKGKKHILIVDRFSYGDRTLALIHIIQSPTKQFLKLGLPQWTETWVDVTDPTCLEPIANWIDGHRKVAIENDLFGLNP